MPCVDSLIWLHQFNIILIYNAKELLQITPYAGSRLYGNVIATFVRGQMVYHDGQHSSEPCGRKIIPEAHAHWDDANV